MTSANADGWEIFTGAGQAPVQLPEMPEPPTWRRFGWQQDPAGAGIPDPPAEPRWEELAPLDRETDETTIQMVNAALRLRRPLLVTGRPGAGKSTLARLVARELRLGPVLRWPITSSSRLSDGLYEYDAIGWVQEQQRTQLAHHGERTETGPADQLRQQRRIGDFIRLGPLGTALLPWRRPRVLLIDEIDKADIDLPNDLLHVFEEGEFDIPELFRLPSGVRAEIEVFTADRDAAAGGAAGIGRRVVGDGVVGCAEFPLVLMTSNGERAFPQAFLRRCLRLELAVPTGGQLRAIVDRRVSAPGPEAEAVIDLFTAKVESGQRVAVDQVLNAIFILSSAGERWSPERREQLAERFLQELG